MSKQVVYLDICKSAAYFVQNYCYKYQLQIM